MIVDYHYTDVEIEKMLRVSQEIYAKHKGMLSRSNAKRQRSEAVWCARRHGWPLKRIAHTLNLSISRTSVL